MVSRLKVFSVRKTFSIFQKVFDESKIPTALEIRPPGVQRDMDSKNDAP